MNRDGKPDLAVIHHFPPTISILLNQGGGAFTLASSYPLSNEIPEAIAAADLDGDGAAELVVAESISNVVSVWKNSGTGQFTRAATVPAGENLHRVVLADLNGDGRPDLAASQDSACCPSYGEVIVALNGGNGTFGLPSTYWTGNASYSLAAGDLDRDGDLDLVVADLQNQAWWLLNRGNGTFVLRGPMPMAGQTFDLAAGDLDGDGDADVVGVLDANDQVVTLTSHQESVSNDCNKNGRLDSCDIAIGESTDCNLNGIPDECDVVSTSSDCNENSVPDECELRDGTASDCNTNRVPDECDLANGTEQDCNHNNRPDSCDPDNNENGIPDDCDLMFDALLVKADAEGDGSGRDWANAVTDLQTALDMAYSSEGRVKQIWVAGGIYRPSRYYNADAREASFRLLNNVALRGGFAGTETRPSERNLGAGNLSILDGDLMGNDDGSFASRADNAYHVVTASDLSEPSLLDGFVIRGGNATTPASASIHNSGAGLFIDQDPDQGYNQLVVSNCTFRDNWASARGGGAYLRITYAKLVNCYFIANRSGGSGGAVAIEYGQPVLMGCVLSGNQTNLTGGAVYSYDAGPTLTNCTVVGNAAMGKHGGVHFVDGSAYVYNSILWGNTDGDQWTDTEQAQIWYDYCGDYVDHSCVMGWSGRFNGTGSFGTDPLLIDPIGSDGVAGTGDENLHVRAGSPCIDAGDNTKVLADVADLDNDGGVGNPTPLDLDGKPRFVEDPTKPDTGVGIPPIVDMGAYERSAPLTPWRLYVNQHVEGANNGTSWNDAFWYLQSALDAAKASGGVVTEIWVAAGSYRPTKRTIPNDPRSATFELVSGVAIYGGFGGNETSLDQRDLAEYVPELSGDLNYDDPTDTVAELARCVSRSDSSMPLGPGCEAFDFDKNGRVNTDDIFAFMHSPRHNDNAYRVVTVPNAGPGTILDCVAVTYGVGGDGAGIRVDQGSLTLRNCKFLWNMATYAGGGFHSRGGVQTFSDCFFYGNIAAYEGGGIDGSNGSISVNRCGFSSNGAVSGGSAINLFKAPATIIGCDLSGNVAGYSGAAVRAFRSGLDVQDCLFSSNVAGYSGAGIETYGTTLSVHRSRFVSNKARNGAGINASGGWDPVIPNADVYNCAFIGNSADYAGGAMNLFRTGEQVVNSAFVGNHAEYSGGAIDEYESMPTMTNCTFADNSAGYGGSAINNFRSNPTLINCIVWGNTNGSIRNEENSQPHIQYSDLQEPFPGPGNISRDPLLRHDVPGDARLGEGSPCIDAGNSGVAVGTDLAGRPRFVDDPFTPDTGAGSPPIVDMGAYEYFPDCNRNEVNDQDDIASGRSRDCNANGKPDECEPDCNHNGIADACDIAAGTSQDCNLNGVPDECDPDCDKDGVPDGCEAGAGSLRMLAFRLDPKYIDQGRHGAIEQPAFSQPPAKEAVVRWPGMCLSPSSPVEGAHLTLFPNPEGPWTSYDGGPFPGEPVDLFGVELRALLLVSPTQAGPITFEFGADDLALLRIDGQEAFSPIWHGTAKVTWTLAPGSHEFMLRTVEFGGGADIRLGWDADNKGGPRVCIPSSAISLTVDCNHNGLPDSCDITAGTSQDCNHNGVPDECDIASGVDKDCDGNGVPDSCDLAAGTAKDCNHNGISDACDLASGTSNDCNVNGVPDECDLADGYEPDCNKNGIPDICDLNAGTSQDANDNGILDECEPPPCAGTRELPVAYAPGMKMTAIIKVTPGQTVAVHAVEDKPPAGWTVGAVNEGGVFDAATGKVKWGPFMDHTARTLTYEVTPPAGTLRNQCFGPGVVSVDGVSTEICGAACVTPCFDHPADANGDRRMVIDEVTAYASCWKQGCTWPVSPNPIPIGYMTRAGALWKHGETYCCDASQSPPMLWVNCPLEPPGNSSQQLLAANGAPSAVRSVRPDGDSFVVAIEVQPGAAAAYAIEESMPAGWSVSAVDENGLFDPAARQVRWGPFFDGNARQLSYRAVPGTSSSSSAITGVLSIDGMDQAVTGSAVIILGPDLDRDGDVDAADLNAFVRCVSGPALALPSPDCAKADFDADGDVDQSDFGILQRCFSGNGKPADPNCAN